MMSWWFDPVLNDGVAARHFESMDAVFALSGELVARAPLSHVIRVELEGRRYYVKRYAGNGRRLTRRWFGLRQWLVPPRVRTEWRNLARFAAWGIPSARLVAYGLERRWGGFRRGVLITEEVRDADDLATLVARADPRLSDSGWVRSVLDQVAAATRRMHAEGFVHNDLKWRNLLVTRGDVPHVHFIDCPNGGFCWGPFLRYRIVKDLACLDKVAKYALRRTQRLRFFLSYLGVARLPAHEKKRVARIVAFFEGRE
jgi:tRNA A-37 threonylcarbamoyl transferase component Bud32